MLSAIEDGNTELPDAMGIRLARGSLIFPTRLTSGGPKRMRSGAISVCHVVQFVAHTVHNHPTELADLVSIDLGGVSTLVVHASASAALRCAPAALWPIRAQSGIHLLPALALALHLAIERWRSQLIPLYTLAALVLVCRMPALLGHISGIATLPAVRPLLLLISANSNRFPDTIEAWTQLIRNATDAADWLELPNSSHLSFTFSQLLSPLLVPDGFEPQRGLRVIDKYLRIFFDAHLRDGPTPALGPAPGTMDVHWHTR